MSACGGNHFEAQPYGCELDGPDDMCQLCSRGTWGTMAKTTGLHQLFTEPSEGVVRRRFFLTLFADTLPDAHFIKCLGIALGAR